VVFTTEGLCTKRRFQTASPPDVRRRLCLAVKDLQLCGCAARSAFGPKIWGIARTTGKARFSKHLLSAGRSPASHQAAKPQRSSKMTFLCKASRRHRGHRETRPSSLNPQIERHHKHRLAVLHAIHQLHETEGAASVFRQRRHHRSLLFEFGVRVLTAAV
jgi:hypothetical protein